MKRTRICDLLRIEHPIIQGGMLGLANAELSVGLIREIIPAAMVVRRLVEEYEEILKKFV
ncbi:MAG: hypothetical protein ABSH06_27910 [Thermodesulfobacteriota bacterium]|jgi:hypothetical protein